MIQLYEFKFVGSHTPVRGCLSFQLADVSVGPEEQTYGDTHEPQTGEEEGGAAALAGAEQPIEEAVSDVLHRAVALCVFLYFTKVGSVFQYS